MANVPKVKNIKKLVFFAVVIIVLLAVGIYFYNMLTQAIVLSLFGQRMRLYKDPDKYFSIYLPSAWQVDHQVGTVTTGPDNDHLNPYDVEYFAFMSKPVNYSEPNDATILFVEVWRKGQCLDDYSVNTKFDGMQAYYDGTSMYEINNNTASIRLYEHIPGIDEKNPSDMEGNPGGPLMIPPTPPPPSWNSIVQNRALIKKIISTFRFASTTPASCPQGK